MENKRRHGQVGGALASEKRKPLEIKKVRRYQKRRKSRRVEAVEQDFARWDAAAGHLGLNFSEFCRRAMNTAATAALKLAGVD